MHLRITQPDDWHVHLRDGEMLKRVVPYTASQFGRALVMPNLTPPVATVHQAMDYRRRILESLSANNAFDPRMSLYLTDHTSVKEVEKAARNPNIAGFKLYPAGATTHSDSGVTKISRVMNVLEAMAKNDVILQVHGEVTDIHVDIYDRESEFIDQVLCPLHHELPDLKFVLEHITTSQGVEFVKDSSACVAGTITPHHLIFNRNRMFEGGIHPHLYCLPVLKREPHRQALLGAATSGNPSFFLGTDSAPHSRSSKQSDCGCAGIFSACAAIELYAEVFDQAGCIDRLEGFASHFGADFYNVPRNSRKITLTRQEHQIPERIPSENQEKPDDLVPLLGGSMIHWKLTETTEG